MNYSKQRELIYNTLRENVVHPSAEYIYNVLKKEHPTISLATVYRNLKKLSEIGQIKKIEGLEGRDHFDHNVHPHYHILCTNCGQIMDISEDIAPELCAKAQEASGYDIYHYEITFRGICPKCKN